MTDSKVGRRGRQVWVLLGIGLLVRTVYVWEYLHSPLFGDYPVDHAYYRDWALRIAAGDWLGSEVFDKGPLYPYLLGLVYRLIGPHDGCVLALQVLLGAVTPLLVFGSGRRLLTDRGAFWAGLLTAVYGPLVYYDCMLMKTFLLPLLVAAFLYVGLRYGESRHPGWLWPAGLFLGLMCLVQENHVLLAAPLLSWVWHVDGRTRPAWRRRLRSTAIIAFATALSIIPCAVRNYLVSGKLVLVTVGGGEVFYIAHGPDAQAVYSPPSFVTADASQEHRDFLAEAERRLGRQLTRQECSRYWFGEALRYAARHPGRELALSIHKALVLFQDFEVPDSVSFAETRQRLRLLYALPTFGWFVPWGAIGVLVSLRSFKRFQLPLGLAAMLVLSVLLTYNFGRFRIALVPVWMLFTAQGFGWFASVWRRRSEPMAAMAAVGCLLFVILATAAAYLPQTGADYTLSRTMRDAASALNAGDLAGAEARFREALRIGRGTGDEAAIHNNLGVALARQGKLEEAHEHFFAAVQLNPQYTDAQQNLSRLREHLRRSHPSP